jgi:hypothetical protein
MIGEAMVMVDCPLHQHQNHPKVCEEQYSELFFQTKKELQNGTAAYNQLTQLSELA